MTDTSEQPIRARMAPSPTGPLHIGTARTSLYNFLFARHFGGTYVLRIEDTDLVRSTADYERDIIDNLHWLGITWDEGPQVAGGEDIGPFGPYRQSNRSELYAAEADRLLEGPGVPLLVHPGGAGGVRRGAGGEEGGAALQPPLPAPDRCGARAVRRRGDSRRSASRCRPRSCASTT